MISLKSALSLLVISLAGASAQCTLTAPNVNLLTAQGLASPWQLGGGCTQADPNTQSFMEATVFEPAQNKIFAYAPLIIDAGTTPLVPPVVPKISAQAIIVYHFGSNANTLTLMDQTNGKTLQQALCVNGVAGSVFGQFAYCNGPNFFRAAAPAIRGQLTPLGKALDGSPCQTTRSFALIDQDQSDNVVTTYLQVGQQTAQNTAANRANFKNATVIANPSDNALLTQFVDPAIGCKPFTVPALDDPGAMRSTLAGDEIHAAAFQAPPVALVPLNDPMVLNNGNNDLQKVNLYRAGTDQPPAANNNGADGKTYCMNYANIAPPVILRQGQFTAKATTPAAGTGTTLFTFLGARFNQSWTNLGCQALTGMPSPIIANLDGNGVATSLTFFIGGKQFGPTSTGGNIVGVPIGQANSSTSMNTMSQTTSSSTSMSMASTASTTSTTSATMTTMTRKHRTRPGQMTSTTTPAAATTSTTTPAAATTSTSTSAAATTTSAAATTTMKHHRGGNGGGNGNGGAATTSAAATTTTTPAAATTTSAATTTTTSAAAATTTTQNQGGNGNGNGHGRGGHGGHRRHGRRGPSRINRF